MVIIKARAVVLAVTAALVFTTGAQANAQLPAAPAMAVGSGGWVGTWGAAPAGPVSDTPNGYPNYSIRNVIHTSVGGSSARVRLSNLFGTAPLVMGHASVAVGAAIGTADAVPGTVRELTFGGSPSVTIPAGAEVQSDAVALAVPDDADLLVTTFTPLPSGPVTYHPAATQTSAG